MTELKPVRVQWRVSADVECPYCEHDNDFMEVDEFWVHCPVAENQEKFFYPITMTCDNCKKKFQVDGADY